MNIEQIKQVLEGAEEADNHFLELDGKHTRYTRLASDHHCLDDLRTILAQHEEIQLLREQLEIQTKRGDMVSGAIDTALDIKEQNK
jgi:hypothetical protein